MKYTNKKKLIAMMALLIVAASFGGCNSANTAATISSEATSSEIVSSAPVSSEATSSEAVSSAPVSSEVEKSESEAASSEATTSSAAEVSSKTEAPVVSSEPAASSVPTAVSQPAVSSAPAAVSQPATTSQPVSSAATTAPAAAKTVSAPAQPQSGSTKAFENMTIEEQDQWLLDQLNEQLGSMEVHEYGTDGGNSAESTQPAEGTGDVYEAIRLINEERVKAGLNEVEIDDTMMEMAAVRAKEMSEVFSHTRPDGTDCWTIFEEFGKRPPFYGGENGGAGKRTAKAQVESWMNSEGHRENILTANATVIGVGYYDSYWAMLLSDS